MTNDELLAKLLDDTLTEAERLELNTRMAATPHFAEEVREYLAVEEMLAKTKISLTTAPAQLLQTVEQKTAATIMTAAATTVVAETVTRSALTGRLLTVASALVIGGAATWYFVTSGSPATDTPVHPIAEQQSNYHHTPEVSVGQHNSEQAEPVAPVSTRKENNENMQTERVPVGQASQHLTSTDRQQKADPVVTPPPTQTAAAEASSNIDAQKNDRNNAAKQLEQQLDSYKMYKANGNTINLMITAKKVGIVYRTLKEFDNSRVYLEEALSLARKQHIDDEEAIVTGELGLLEKERGSLDQARQLLQTCVDKLRALRSPQLQRWQDELAELRKEK